MITPLGARVAAVSPCRGPLCLDYTAPTVAARAGLERRVARFADCKAASRLVATALPGPWRGTVVASRTAAAHPDRVVLRLDVRGGDGGGRALALKLYADETGGSVFDLHRRLAALPAPPPTVDPLAYVAPSRALLAPWVDAVSALAGFPGHDDAALLRDAARGVARLHTSGVVAARPTEPSDLVAQLAARNERTRRRWPDAAHLVDPLLAALGRGCAELDAWTPALVHGDFSLEHVLRTARGPVFIDLDAFGLADPAYDAGHFSAQLERHCQTLALSPASTRRRIDAFRTAWLAAVPGASGRNADFYRALTLARKIHTVMRRDGARAAWFLPALAAAAHAALAAFDGGGSAR